MHHSRSALKCTWLIFLPAVCGFLIVGCSREDPPAQSADVAAPPAPSLFESPEVAPDLVSLEGEMAAPGVADASLVEAKPPGPDEPVITPEIVDTNLSRLQEAVDDYRADYRRLPASLEQLVAVGYLPIIPRGPAGKKYIVNQTTGQIESVNQ
jgi:hypothetical protein